MTDNNNQDQPSGDDERPVTRSLHPIVFVLLIGATAWFALAVWGFAGGGGVTDYLLFIVSGFIFIVVALTIILSRVGHGKGGAGGDVEKPKPPSFHDWAASDFDTWQDRLSGAQAAILILLPIAAAAIGMTLFAIEFRFAAHGAV